MKIIGVEMITLKAKRGFREFKYIIYYGVRCARLSGARKRTRRYEKLIESPECLQSAIAAFVFELEHLNARADNTIFGVFGRY